MKSSKKDSSGFINLNDFNLDKNRKIKLYRQLFDSVVNLIESNAIPSGTKLPSVRDLSSGLKISKNTVTKAYEDLQKAGYVYSLSKSGFYTKTPGETVTDDSLSVTTEPSQDEIPTVDSIFKEFNGNIDADNILKEKPFDPVLKDSSSNQNKEALSTPKNAQQKKANIILPTGNVIQNNMTKKDVSISPDNLASIFNASIKQALLQTNTLSKTDTDISGHAEFKVALASFLYKFFNIDVNPSQIFVGTDLLQMLNNILSLPSIKNSVFKKQNCGLLKLAEEVAEKSSSTMKPVVAIKENPDEQIKNIFLRNKIDIRQIPTDDSGIVFNFFVTSGANLAFVSSDDIPVGAVDDFREPNLDIIEWANQESYRYIFELDSLSTTTSFLPLKQYDQNDKIIYMRSFNTFFNLTNACFVVLPKKLAAEYREEYKDFNCPLSDFEQIALTDFIISGKLYNYLENIEEL